MRRRFVGFTATPFRLKTGSICTPDGFLNHICYEVGVRELIRDGYLCPLITKAGTNKPDTDRLHVQAGEYVAGEVEEMMDQNNLVESACGEIVGYSPRARESPAVSATFGPRSRRSSRWRLVLPAHRPRRGRT